MKEFNRDVVFELAEHANSIEAWKPYASLKAPATGLVVTCSIIR